MSAELQENTAEVLLSADQALDTLLHRKWHDYYPDPSDQAEDTERQQRALRLVNEAHIIAIDRGDPYPRRVSWREQPATEPLSQRTLTEESDKQNRSQEIITRLTGEVFKPFNPRVGEAMGASMQAAFNILSPLGMQHARDPSSAGYQAFANYYLMLVALSSEFGLDTPLISKSKHNVTPFPASMYEDDTHAFAGGGLINTYRIDFGGYFGARQVQDIDESGKAFAYSFRRHPIGLAIHTQPGSRVLFSLDQFGSTKEHLEQSTYSYSKNKERQLSDFSIRLDKDEAFVTGFSLDIGRDAKDDSVVKRPGDVVGRALQSARPEYGSHFPEFFENVTDADFDEFIENLNTFLRADAEIARYDQTLRYQQGRSNERWPVDPLYRTHNQQVALTRGARGAPPFSTTLWR